MADEVFSAVDLLGNDGPKPTLSWRGKVYTVSFCCPSVVALMEKEALKSLVSTIKELQKQVAETPELGEYLAPQIAVLQSHITGRGWGYMQAYFQQVMQQSQYQPLQLWAMIADNHKDFTLAEAMALVSEEPEQVETVMGVTDPGFFELLGKTSGLAKANVKKLMVATQEARKKATLALKTHFQHGSGDTQGS